MPCSDIVRVVCCISRYLVRCCAVCYTFLLDVGLLCGLLVVGARGLFLLVAPAGSQGLLWLAAGTHVRDVSLFAA